MLEFCSLLSSTLALGQSLPAEFIERGQDGYVHVSRGKCTEGTTPGSTKGSLGWREGERPWSLTGLWDSCPPFLLSQTPESGGSKSTEILHQNPKLLLLEVGRQRGDLHCFFSGEAGTGSGTGGQWLWCPGHSTLRLVPITPLSQHRPASALHLHPIHSPDQIANIPGEYARPRQVRGLSICKV